MHIGFRHVYYTLVQHRKPISPGFAPERGKVSAGRVVEGARRKINRAAICLVHLNGA
jgi:hypothetical protein